MLMVLLFEIYCLPLKPDCLTKETCDYKTTNKLGHAND